MALVFKIKHQETLRRWVVSESADSDMFSITLVQLEAKVRELFQLPDSSQLAMTYVDKEGDIVTLGEDHDLVDACLVQRLNPLRLEVQVLGSGHVPRESSDNFNMETFLKSLFPQATTEAMQGFLRKYSQLLDPTLPIATLIVRAQDAFREFLEIAARPADHHKPGPSDKGTHHHPYKHPHGGFRSKSMPSRGDNNSPKDAASGLAFHWGVQCDGCGMNPIQGVRYKSTKITDFDLCSSCLQEKGGEVDDYEKIEQPAYGHGHYRPPYLRRGGRPCMGPAMCGRGLFARGPYGWKPERGFGGHPYDDHRKLDARFVKDVTIFDGTELAPGTTFTKIWRMSNIGSLPWPQNTQLMHIGGDVLSSQEAVNVELSEDGLACGEEVEVSVDLTAPEKAGRYVSHWRLISPSGQKFGQRVWVTIQVVPQGEQSPLLQESLKGEAGKRDGMNVTFANPVDMITIEDVTEKQTAEANDDMMATEGLAGPSSHGGGAKEVEYDINREMEGFSLVEKSVNNLMEAEMINNAENTEKSELELKLQSLESMGFSNRELNTFLLNKNNENMQRTLDDLLVAAGWDGVLRDLQEMGFTDQSTNIQLLLKYKGSVKAAVKDLVRMEKQKA